MSDPRTLKEMVLDTIKEHPGWTASQVATFLRCQRDRRHWPSAGSVSATLKRLADKGVLAREDGRGPRGGIGYYHFKRPNRYKLLVSDSDDPFKRSS